MTCIWNKTFEKNISQFKIRFPELYSLLEKEILALKNLFLATEKKFSDENSLDILNSVFPFWNFLFSKSGIITAKECETFIHSSYNPISEAHRLFSTVDLSTDEAWIFAGIGLGYSAIDFASIKTDKLLVIVEPDPLYFFAAMSVLDFTPVFSKEKCIIITGALVDTAVPLIDSICTISRAKVITQVNQTNHQKEWFKTFFSLLERNRQKENINTKTLESFSTLWMKNSSRNLKYFPEFNGINIYKNMLPQQIPAVVIAAGPTLEELLPYLSEIKKRAVLIAVDTALKALLKNKIEPDFVLLIDPQYYAATHILGLNSRTSVLITESSVYPSVMRLNFRKKVLCESLFPLGRFFETSLLKEKSFGKLASGGSVSTSAWDFAKFIGAKKIYMAGLDLGFPEKKTHIRGSTFEEKSFSTGTRISSIENSLSNILFSAQNEKAFSFDNSTIITDSKMKLFAWWFESQIAKQKPSDSGSVTTFTLSKKSLFIPGMLVASKEDLLTLPECEKEKFDFFSLSESKQVEFSYEDFSSVKKLLLDHFSALLEKAKKGYSICSSILKEAPLKAEISAKQKLNQISEIDNFILASEAKKVASLVFPTERQLENLFKNEKQYDSQILSSIKKSEIIYRELINSINKYLKYL